MYTWTMEVGGQTRYFTAPTAQQARAEWERQRQELFATGQKATLSYPLGPNGQPA